MANGEAELRITANLEGVREALTHMTAELRLTIAEFMKVWEPIERAIGTMTWEEVQTVFPDSNRSDLWKLWEAAADKHQNEANDDGM
jgi:hypothetical protein